MLTIANALGRLRKIMSRRHTISTPIDGRERWISQKIVDGRSYGCGEGT